MTGKMLHVAAVAGAVVLGAAALTACGGTTQTEPTPARVTVTAAPTPAAETPAETPAEPATWPTVAQTWEAHDEAGGEGAEPADESNCGLTCPGAPASPDWTTIPVQPEPVESYAPMPDITETPEVGEEGAYVAE